MGIPRWCSPDRNFGFYLLLYVGDGSIKLILQGSGTATLDYGNPYTGGTVKVYLNNVEIDSAGKNTPSKKKVFDFKDGGVLKLTEKGVSVLAINSLQFQCGNLSRSRIARAVTFLTLCGGQLLQSPQVSPQAIAHW